MRCLLCQYTLQLLICIALFQLLLLLLLMLIKRIDLLCHIHALVNIRIHWLVRIYLHIALWLQHVIAPRRHVIARNELLIGLVI